MSESVEPAETTEDPADEATIEVREESHAPEKLATAFFFAVFLVLIAACTYLLADYITDFILALLFAYIAYPSFIRLRDRLRGRTQIAAVIITALIVVIVLVPTSFLVASLSAEAVEFYDTTRESVTVEGLEETLFGDSMLATTVKKAADMLGVEYTPGSVRDAISGTAGAVASFLGGQINTLVSNLFAVLFHFVICMLMVFYLLCDGPALKRFVFDLSPLPEDEEELLARKFGAVGRATLFGNGIGSVIQGLMGGILMAIVGLPSAVLWGTVMTIFAFLPLVGVSVVVVPASIYLALEGRWAAALVFLVLNMVQAIFVENVVKTKLIGSHMKMHSLLIFLSILGGLAVFGILGILYGPLVVTMFLTFTELYQLHYKKSLAEQIRRQVAAG